jgi:ankyrin repeat protein
MHNAKDVLVYLLNRGARGDESDGLGDTAAHIAARHGHPDMLDVLYMQKISICQVNNRGETPISIAHENGNDNLVNFLVMRGCSNDKRFPVSN